LDAHIRTFDHIWRHSLEGTAVGSYAFAIGFGPALAGYLCGRWMPVFVRALPLLAVLASGYWWTRYSAHAFGHYLFGNALYVVFTVVAISRRAKKMQVRFWRLNHFDWITAVIATALMTLVYTKPQA
jgi:hypothetical protein